MNYFILGFLKVAADVTNTAQASTTAKPPTSQADPTPHDYGAINNGNYNMTPENLTALKNEGYKWKGGTDHYAYFEGKNPQDRKRFTTNGQQFDFSQLNNFNEGQNSTVTKPESVSNPMPRAIQPFSSPTPQGLQNFQGGDIGDEDVQSIYRNARQQDPKGYNNWLYNQDPNSPYRYADDNGNIQPNIYNAMMRNPDFRDRMQGSLIDMLPRLAQNHQTIPAQAQMDFRRIFPR